MIPAYLALAAAIVVTVAATTLPGALHAAAPYLVAGLWAYAMWLARRADARRYHRYGRPGAHRHTKPTRLRRLRMLARRIRSLRLRTAAEVAPEPDGPPLTLGQHVQRIQEVFGTAAYVVTGFEDTVPISHITTHPDIRQFARTS
jgi:hypothetical protein